jgi:FkbM family methyltransferase
LTHESVFDTPDALRIVEARQSAVRPLLAELRQELRMKTAVDVGCGVGRFSSFLQELGYKVTGLEGREHNVQEARCRYPDIEFHQADVENEAIARQGTFDLAFCFGLLYHLENPLLAIRHLRALTTGGLLLESMCIPDAQASMLLLNEPRLENQSLTDVAFYPSESCLVKMLYRAGFSAVYRLAVLPDHEEFRETAELARRRTVLFASTESVNSPHLVPLAEPKEMTSPWEKRPNLGQRVIRRGKRFLSMPAREKYLAVGLRVRRFIPGVPLPIPLQFGAWFLARNDYMSGAEMHGGFEPAERAFVSRFLRAGMTALDIGAHHGLYTLLASKRVGPNGQVFAFEPSPRERKALQRNVGLNRCKNVIIEGLALGNEEGEGRLYVVQGHETGCNSLKPPSVNGITWAVPVHVSSLDQWLATHNVGNVDFIKLDVEGGELAVLQGAQKLLESAPRPVILAEVQDIRTQPWGYRASEVIRFLSDKGYKWFSLSSEGALSALDVAAETFDGNFVACPEESESLLGH